jgi:hypothetical protein
MYYYWKEKGIKPSEFYNMNRGELTVVRAFYERELKDKNKKMKEMSKSGFACPFMF